MTAIGHNGAPMVTRGTFSDFKLVKSRSVAQLVIEVPLEGADDALGALGGLPKPGEETWVAVARLTAAPVSGPEKPHTPFHKLPPSTQCAMKCAEADFQKWLGQGGEEETAAYLRSQMGVKSRAELDTNDRAAGKWRHCLASYEDFRLGRR